MKNLTEAMVEMGKILPLKARPKVKISGDRAAMNRALRGEPDPAPSAPGLETADLARLSVVRRTDAVSFAQLHPEVRQAVVAHDAGGGAERPASLSWYHHDGGEPA